MLKIMRSNKFFSVFFLGLLAIAITVVFVFSGIGPQQNTSEVVVALVNKKRITLAEYEKAYEMAYRRAKEVYKDSKEIEKLNLRETVLEEMINNVILLDAAESAGLRITDEELRNAIMNEPAFHKDGVFDKEIYTRRLSLARMYPEMFEEQLRKDLLLDKIRRLITETAELSDTETKILASLTEKEQGQDKAKSSQMNNARLYDSILYAKKELSIKAYVQGLKRRMNIDINEKFTSY